MAYTKINDDSFFTTIVFENLKRFGDMEFDISKHVLDIVYSQTICWFAIFFSPLISALTMVKIFAVFYLRLFFVKYVSTHQRKMVKPIIYVYYPMVFTCTSTNSSAALQRKSHIRHLELHLCLKWCYS